MKADIFEDFKERLTAEMRAKELGTRIKLRLNPNEPEHNRLVQLIAEMSSKGYELNHQYLPADEERMTSKPLVPLSADSIGKVTRGSTSSAERPGASV